MALVTNVICDGCGTILPSVAAPHAVTIHTQDHESGNPRTLHFGVDLCKCGFQVKQFVNQLVDRRGAAVNPD